MCVCMLMRCMSVCINTLRFYVSVCLCVCVSVSDGSGMFVGRD